MQMRNYLNLDLKKALLIFWVSYSISSAAQVKSEGFLGFSASVKSLFFAEIKCFEVDIIINKYIVGAYALQYQEDGILLSKFPKEHNKQFGVLFGSYLDFGKFRFQYQAGVGTIAGLKRTKFLEKRTFIWPIEYYESKSYSTVGLATRIGIKYIPFTFVSIGIDVISNLNNEKIDLSPMLSINLGLLRQKAKA
jgi:hypothetical protein